MKHLKKILVAILLIIFAIHLGFRISSYSKEYTTKFDAGYWKTRYLQSQWVVPASKNSIGDDGLYAYAGWEYIHGSNPVLLNAEIPPLAKYIIGVGEVVFQNQNILVLMIGLSSLFIFYLINLKLFQNKIAAFIPVFIFSLDPLYYSQLRAPYLDGIYLFFLLLVFLFTLRKNYIFALLFLGCFASIKFPVGSLFLVFPLFAWVFLYDRKQIRKFLFSLVLWPTVFLASYLMYFVHGGSVLEFLGVQKWIIHFYAVGAKAVPGTVYPILLFGKWYTWFSGLVKVHEWNVFWAVSFIGSIFAVLPLVWSLKTQLRSNRGQMSKQDNNMMLILLWVIFYLVFLTFTPVFPRYLLLLLPFMYNLSIWFLGKYVFPHY